MSTIASDSLSTGLSARSVAFITMGCAKNEVDSEHMMLRLVNAGYAIEEDPEQADVVVVNTCSFIQAATEESIDAILEVAGYESIASGSSKIVVAGCMPARYGADLEGELSEVESFVPCSEEKNIVGAVDAAMGIERMPGSDIAVELSDGELMSKPSAYVKISDGCDRFCAYCTIPFIRGRYHSFPFEDIVAEVEKQRSFGAREIVLIAQDTGRWGTDFAEPSSLAWLLGELAERFEDTWFRVMYIQPEGVTDELIDCVAAHGNICSYFDIPFQHSDEKIVRSMNRRGSAEEYLALIEKIRERIPGVTLRTTLIAGYPGETDEEFEGLLAFVEDADLDYVGVFPYSREEGTRSYDLPGQVDEDEKVRRAQEVRDLADAISSSRISRRVGSTVNVLVCGREEDGQMFGRAMSQAPEVDGVTYIDGAEIGDVVSVRIDDTLFYEMEGTIVE